VVCKENWKYKGSDLKQTAPLLTDSLLLWQANGSSFGGNSLDGVPSPIFPWGVATAAYQVPHKPTTRPLKKAAIDELTVPPRTVCCNRFMRLACPRGGRQARRASRSKGGTRWSQDVARQAKPPPPLPFVIKARGADHSADRGSGGRGRADPQHLGHLLRHPRHDLWGRHGPGGRRLLPPLPTGHRDCQGPGRADVPAVHLLDPHHPHRDGSCEHSSACPIRTAIPLSALQSHSECRLPREGLKILGWGGGGGIYKLARRHSGVHNPG